MSMTEKAVTTEDVFGVEHYQGDEYAVRDEIIHESQVTEHPDTVSNVRESVEQFLEWYENSLNTWAVFDEVEGEVRDLPNCNQPIATYSDRRAHWIRKAKEHNKNLEKIGERAVKLQNRFMPSGWEKRYARFKQLEEGIRENFRDTGTQAMITLTASSTNDRGRPIGPIDHFLQLDEGYAPALAELRRVMDDFRPPRYKENDNSWWEYIAIPEPHDSGYLHWHIAVYIDAYVPEKVFQPVLDAHVRNCPLASQEAHRVNWEDDEGGAVETARIGEIGSISAYLSSYMGKSYQDSPDPREMPDKMKIMMATLWATDKQMWRPSNGAQTYMQRDPEEVNTWENSYIIQKIVDRKTGEEIEIEKSGYTPYRSIPDRNGGFSKPPPRSSGVEAGVS